MLELYTRRCPLPTGKMSPRIVAALASVSAAAAHMVQASAGAVWPPPRTQCDFACNVPFGGQGGQTDEAEDHYVFSRLFSNNGSEPRTYGGTFLELGAHDGRIFSNTLFFERALSWRGLLIEPSPPSFEALRRSRGNAAPSVLPANLGQRNTLVHSAVGCPTPFVEFRAAGLIGAMQPGRQLSGPAVPYDHRAQRPPLHQPSRSAAPPKGRPGPHWVSSSAARRPSSATRSAGRVTSRVPCRRLDELLQRARIGSLDFFSLDTEVCISPASPLNLPCTSPAPRLHLAVAGGGARGAANVQLVRPHRRAARGAGV